MKNRAEGWRRKEGKRGRDAGERGQAPFSYRHASMYRDEVSCHHLITPTKVRRPLDVGARRLPRSRNRASLQNSASYASRKRVTSRVAASLPPSPWASRKTRLRGTAFLLHLLGV